MQEVNINIKQSIWQGIHFNVIYCDCPWKYSFQRIQKNGGCTYPTMSTKELCDLPIAQIAAKDSVLFQWATWPKLKEAIEVMEAWGFTYKTNGFIWVKTNKKNNQWYSGTGSYTNGNTEVCLIGTKGKCLKRTSKSVKQVIVAPIGKHSAKPLEVRHRIEQLYGNLPRIELFARQTALGWVSVGNEIDDQDIRDALATIINKIEQNSSKTTQFNTKKSA